MGELTAEAEPGLFEHYGLTTNGGYRRTPARSPLTLREDDPMLALVLFLILLWVVAGIVGFVVHGLFWLFIVACLLFLFTLVLGGFRARAPQHTSSALVTLVGVVPAGSGPRQNAMCCSRQWATARCCVPAQRISCRYGNSPVNLGRLGFLAEIDMPALPPPSTRLSRGNGLGNTSVG